LAPPAPLGGAGCCSLLGFVVHLLFLGVTQGPCMDGGHEPPNTEEAVHCIEILCGGTDQASRVLRLA
jgi:hypothetical protein